MKRNIKIIPLILFTFMLVMMCNMGAYASETSSFYPSVQNASSIRNTVSVDEEQEKVVSNVKVFYNPIAEQISVSLKLNKQNNVTIKVMDALGNEVLSLMNGPLELGNQNLSFETNDKLTAGFYFVRVSVGSETVVKRISVR